MTGEVYRYRAFISYRHAELDRKWARWLIEKLETYRTPRALVRSGVPSRIGHLFRDDDEIPASSDLSHQIEDALRSSQYLIVVCSPATPASKWIAREIEFFRTLHRDDRILALLVNGEPGQSFPESLRRLSRERIAPDGSRSVEWVDAEPIAADVRARPDERTRDTERRAFLRIAAGLLQCSFDDLFQRERLRRQRRQRTIGAVVAVCGIAASVAAYSAWDYNRIKTSYYVDFGTRWGIPFGIGELRRDVVAHRATSYAIDMQRDRIIAMRRVNGSGSLRALSGDGFDAESWYAGVAEWRIHYDGDHFSSIGLYGDQGRFIRAENYQFLSDKRTATESYANANGNAVALATGMSNIVTFAHSGIFQSKSQIAACKITFTDEGFVDHRMFQNAFGQPAEGASDSFGRSYNYYRDGQIESFHDVDPDGHPRVDQLGIAEVRRYYAPTADFIAVEWRDARGKLTLNPHGYAIWKAHLDQYGNDADVEFRGSDRELVIARNLNAARVSWRYDAHGNLVEENYFGPDGVRIVNQGGYARLIRRYNAEGAEIESIYFGLDGKSAPSKRGYSRVGRRYDARGNLIEIAYFGENGKLILSKETNFARLERRYDADRNVVEEAYFGADGHPILNNNGFARVTRRRLEQGREVVDYEDYFGTRGERIVRSDVGAARIASRYDPYGNVVQENYFGVDGKPVLRAGLGFAMMTAAYDDLGNVTEESYFDVDGKLVARGDFGVARIVRRYSENGEERVESYFGVDGRLTSRKGLGISGIDAHFDQRGNEVEEDYLGTDGKLFAREDLAVARITWRYDKNGNEVSENYFGTDGKKRTLRKDLHVAGISIRYDARGERVEEDSYGIDGAIALNNEGFAKLMRRFDANGHQVEEAYLGIRGEPVVRSDLGAARITWSYDARGNQDETSYFGANGKLTLNRYGFARQRKLFDGMNRVVAVLRFDVEGRLISQN